MKREQAIANFISDSLELMQNIKIALRHLQRSPTDVAIINTIPCATQAIKKLSNFHGCQHIVSFSCVFEWVLSRLRNAESCLETDQIALLVTCCDHVSAMVRQLAARDTELLSETFRGHLEISLELISQLRAHHTEGQDAQWPLTNYTDWSSDMIPANGAFQSP